MLKFDFTEEFDRSTCTELENDKDYFEAKRILKEAINSGKPIDISEAVTAVEVAVIMVIYKKGFQEGIAFIVGNAFNKR